MDAAEKKLNLLCLEYSRQTSKAHTIFSSWIEVMFGVTIGFFGIVFAYSEVFNLTPDIYKLIALGEASLIVAGVISIIAFIPLYQSRIERKDITKKIKALRTT